MPLDSGHTSYRDVFSPDLGGSSWLVFAEGVVVPVDDPPLEGADPDEEGGGIGAQKSVFHGHIGEVGRSEEDMNYVAGGGEVGVGVDACRISPGDLFVGDFMEAVVGQASSRFFANVELPSNYYVSLPKLWLSGLRPGSGSSTG